MESLSTTQSSILGESASIDKKYKAAKELPPADIKLILLGDSAVGKSKYTFLHKYFQIG